MYDAKTPVCVATPETATKNAADWSSEWSWQKICLSIRYIVDGFSFERSTHFELEQAPIKDFHFRLQRNAIMKSAKSGDSQVFIIIIRSVIFAKLRATPAAFNSPQTISAPHCHRFGRR